MKKLFLVLSLILSMTFVTGCVMSGNKRAADEDLVAQIKKGVYTKSDVVDTLGDPNSRNIADNGEETWRYEYYKGNRSIIDFIPVVNSFVGGSETEAHILTIGFDKDGVVKSMNRHHSTMGTKQIY